MTLEERITYLEDIEAIKQLKAKYCEACDDAHNAEKVAALFDDDGIWDSGEGVRVEGRAAIRDLFSTFNHTISFSQHNVMNPIIEIKGCQATGIWYLIELITFREKDDSRLLTARYDEEYVKINGCWKYKLLKGQSRFMSTVETMPWSLPQ